MCSQKWSCHTSFDSAMDLSGDELTIQEEYIKIEVRNPRTHINKTKALYTDYEIHVQTNNIAFSKSDSCVRRRYSDFQWLHKRLSTQFFLERSLPELPPKRLFGRFKRQFLKYRKRGLQRFLENIAKESVYLSDISVHLFLQTDLPVKEIECRLGGTESCGELVDVLQSVRCFKNGKLACDYQDDDNCDCEVNFECDSGFSYSTTGSITDITSTQAPTNENCKLFNSNKYYDNSLQFQKSCLTDDMQYEILQKVGHLSCESNLTSDDDISIDYDADNEVDETQEKNNNIPLLDNDEFFLFKKNLGKEYTLERAFELIQKRTKPSERFFAPDLDSDDCFDVSEYDIIDSDNEVSSLNNCFERLSKSHLSVKSKNRPGNSVRNILSDKDGPQLKNNKFIIAKVRSLPKLRFPMKHIERNKIIGRNLTSDRSRVNTLKPSSTLDDCIFAKVSDDGDNSILKISQVNSGQLSSDDDYLTTIHTIASKDSHLDTQSGDVPPSQVYDYIKRGKKRAKGLTSIILNLTNKQCGRFSVSAVNPFMSTLIERNGQKCDNEKINPLRNELRRRISTDTFNFSYTHSSNTCPKDALYQQSALCSYNPKDSQLLETYDIL